MRDKAIIEEKRMVSKPGWQDFTRPSVYVPTLGLMALVLAPVFIESSYSRHVLIMTLMFASLSLAWNIIGGYGGQFSLGHAVFFGIGAYTSTLLLKTWTISPWIGMLVGGMLAILASLVVGLTCFRFRSHYFAIATIAFGEVSRLLTLYLRDVTAGAQGLTVPFLGEAPLMYQFRSKAPYYYVALALLAITLFVTYRIRQSRLGYYLLAIGQNQDAAEAVGVNVVVSKQYALAVSAFLSALVGTFYAQYIYFIEPDSVFSLDTSILICLVAIVGGVATLGGPIFGAFLLIPVRELATVMLGDAFAGADVILYGVVLIVVILVQPAGLIDPFAKLYDRVLQILPGGKAERNHAQQ